MIITGALRVASSPARRGSSPSAACRLRSTPWFMTAQTAYARVAPKGRALICAFKQLDPRHPTDPREDEREFEDLLDAAQLGWRAEVLRRRYLPRIEAVGALPTAARGFAGRLQTRVPGLWNLYPSGTTLCRFGSLLAFTATFRTLAGKCAGVTS
jgi:hypothetical protein